MLVSGSIMKYLHKIDDVFHNTCQLSTFSSAVNTTFAKMSSEAQVYLGLADEFVEGHGTSWDINKIGGSPDWHNKDTPFPRCRLCERLQNLVSQVYCPLQNSPYHRTLYVFACVNKACWNQSQSWTVLRSQTCDPAQPAQSEAPLFATDDDWGTDAGDWGDTSDSFSESTDENLTKTTSEGNSRQEGTAGEHIAELSYASAVSSSLQRNANDSVQDSDVVDTVVTLEDLTIEDSGLESETDKQCTDEVLDCMAEVVPCKPTSNLQSIFSSDGNSQNHDATPDELILLDSFFVSVIAEPSGGNQNKLKHEHKLLREYSKKEGVALNDFTNLHSSQSAGKGGGGVEKYEKSLAHHGDRLFQKFTKNVATCPEQIMRYHLGGKPLYISTPPGVTVNACGHCGAACRFEFQLMPALVTMLTNNQMSEVCEFGVVLVYTCSQSCWQDGDTHRLEEAIVQPDPDLHLFKL